jgi:hypothetical protein
MKRGVIVLAEAGAARDRIAAFFETRSLECALLSRAELREGRSIVVDESRVLVDGRDWLHAAAAAIVLDSGLMWPIPELDPTEEQWRANAERFDDYLREERERQSLWYSLHEILGDALPVCVNPPATFAHEALKPAALARLEQAGARVPPWLCTNDPDALARLERDHPGAFVEVPLVRGAPRRVWQAGVPAGLALEREPVLVVATGDAPLATVVLVGERAFVAGGGHGDLARAVQADARVLHEAFGSGWLELICAPGEQGWRLVDFSAAPDLSAWSDEHCLPLLEALHGLVAKGRESR